jgi:hypothetical protein
MSSISCMRYRETIKGHLNGVVVIWKLRSLARATPIALSRKQWQHNLSRSSQLIERRYKMCDKVNN